MFHKDFIVSAGELQRGLLRQRSEAAIGGGFHGHPLLETPSPLRSLSCSGVREHQAPLQPGFMGLYKQLSNFVCSKTPADNFCWRSGMRPEK